MASEIDVDIEFESTPATGEGAYLNSMAKNLGTERRTLETNEELRERLRQRIARFSSHSSTFYDLVHSCEQTILIQSPVGSDQQMIRVRVGMGLCVRNRPEKFLDRLLCALKVFWTVLK